MVDNLALGIGSACSWTGVCAFLLDTGLGQGTLGAQETLWPTVGRASEISLETGAHWPGALCPALTVGSTWVWVAGICYSRSN